MFGKESPLSPLELRKRLLIAESEINRVQLCQEWQTLTDGVRGFADRAKTISSYASVVAAFVAGLAAFRRSKAPPGDKKCSWLRTIFKGLKLAGSIWLALRARRREDV